MPQTTTVHCGRNPDHEISRIFLFFMDMVDRSTFLLDRELVARLV